MSKKEAYELAPVQLDADALAIMGRIDEAMKNAA